ncbi:hypothetical protein [Anaerocolumna sp. MB42-C2]|uniref:hypothetical protein n=1 Tax=Anaerocolumna sp. MB42-C2 TaxID=3070997 RepID=UPI0027E0A4D5|nr:hypothetical protein [Anaerocolumna sp. MB42-C2]WMJ87609.1 hypothetical protein RBU59_26850 [Anaerocolumna sp. MB42-C2]
MEMLCIVDSGNTYRVRKEEEGCSIFGPGHFIEGNDVLFDILKTFDKNDTENGFNILLKEYQVEPEILKQDLLDIAEGFLANKIFIEMAGKINRAFSEEKK